MVFPKKEPFLCSLKTMRAVCLLIPCFLALLLPALAQKLSPSMPESFSIEMTIASSKSFYAYARNFSSGHTLITSGDYGRNFTEVSKDYNIYLIEQFFNRQICSEFILAGGPLNPPFLITKSDFVGTEMHLGVECDRYDHTHMPIENVTETMWFRKDTHIPVELNIFSFLSRELESFIVHSYSESVPDSVFATPSDCKIYNSISPSTGLEEPAVLELTQKLPESLLALPINSLATVFHPKTYTIGSYPQFEGLSVQQFAQRLLHHLPVQNPFPKLPQRMAKDLPATFDWEEKAPQCQNVFAVRDQGKCGSCWAFGAAGALGDRYCIFHNRTQGPLSPQDLIGCDKRNLGCDGGYLDAVWFTLQERGVTSDSCKPSVSAASGETGPCEDKCADGRPVEYFRSKNAYSPGVTEEEIMNDIWTNGPVETGFYVFNDFQGYKSGIYRRQRGSNLLGSHAVKISGWGEEAGVKYWKVQNSWSTAWGEKGYFRIVRGVNDCGIETHIAAGLV